jgi:hypothetical protein
VDSSVVRMVDWLSELSAGENIWSRRKRSRTLRYITLRGLCVDSRLCYGGWVKGGKGKFGKRREGKKLGKF